MSIRRISDLPKFSFDLNCLTGEANRKAELNYSQFEVSHNENGVEHSQFTSQRIDFTDLCAYMTHHIIAEDLTFIKKKTFQNDSTFRSNVDIYGKFNVESPTIDSKIYSKDLILSAENLKAATTAGLSLSSASNLSVSTINTTKVNAKILDIDLTENLSVVAAQNIFIESPKVETYTNTWTTYLTGSAPTYELCIEYGQTPDKVMWVDDEKRFNFKYDIQGTAMKASWADIAELYESDRNYPEGTLVRFGGQKEITVADNNEVNGVITSKPGVLLNDGKEGGIYCGVAMIGRTPVKVLGLLNKFDKIELSDIPGFARKHLPESTRKVVGIALQRKDKLEVDFVECVVKLEF